MMRSTVSAVITAVFAAAAVAAPRESVTFTNVESVGLLGNPANQTRTATFAGTGGGAGGGAYTARMLTITGGVFDSFGTGTWAREAVIEVTPPGGQSFVCIPFDQGSYVSTATIDQGRYTVPVAPVSPEGVWTFRFAETYDDDLGPFADQTWSDVTITLDDGAPPALDQPIGGVTAAFTNASSDGSVGSGSTVLSHVFTAPGVVNRVQIIGRYTVRSMTSVDNITSLPSQARVRVIPPASTGLAPFETTPVSSGFSTCLANTVIDMPGLAPGGGVTLAGTWGFEFYDATDEPSGVDGVWQNVSFTFQNTNPPAAALITLQDGGGTVEDADFRSASVSTQAGVVRWLRFTLEQDIGTETLGALDIDMVGTSASPENDFSLGLYSGAGDLVAWSYDTGPGALPQITVGRGSRPRVGDGLPYEGQNSTLSPQSSVTTNRWPTLPAGVNYIAVCSGNDGAVFTQSGWQVAPSTESNGPTATVRVRYYAEAPWGPPTGVIQLPPLPGVIRGTVNLGSDLSNRYKWLRFAVPEDVEDGTGYFVDIDTALTFAPANDTSIALYDSGGRLWGFNNDMGVGGPGNPTVRNSALSFGLTTPARNYRSIDPNTPLADGRHGNLRAGVYYLYIGQCCPGYGEDRFWILNDYVTPQASGPVKWNIYSNFEVSPCGPSDVGSQGGVSGSDSHLDSNDFIVFIQYFFSLDPDADVGSRAGLPGQDGQFDNNDFVVFIDQFFTAPAGCR